VPRKKSARSRPDSARLTIGDLPLGTGRSFRNPSLKEPAAEEAREHPRGQEEPGRPAIQRCPSGERPPPDTTQCSCGWCIRFCPEVLPHGEETDLGAECLGPAAMVPRVAAVAAKSSL
jgi:hypothetical protein